MAVALGIVRDVLQGSSSCSPCPVLCCMASVPWSPHVLSCDGGGFNSRILLGSKSRQIYPRIVSPLKLFLAAGSPLLGIRTCHGAAQPFTPSSGRSWVLQSSLMVHPCRINALHLSPKCCNSASN